MDEQLNQVSEQTGVPADLLERAARARAGQQGVAVEALVAGWAGGDAPAPAAAAPADSPAATEAPAAEAAPAATEAPATAEAPAPGAAPASGGAGKLPDALLRRSAAAKAKREGRPLDEVLVEMGLSPEGDVPPGADVAASAAAAEAPAPSTGTSAAVDEPGEEPEPEPEPEPVFAGFPRWLAASFIIIPMLALLYAGFAPNGPDCGTSGQLAVDPVSGEAESCDGGGSAFLTLGQSIYEAQCVACHSADGSGGVGPAFAGGAVISTFGACSDHIEWVTLGSNNWPDPTYGDTGIPVLGTGVAMPGYEASLSAEEIASVVLYERVAFGGVDPMQEEAACGLVEAAGG